MLADCVPRVIFAYTEFVATVEAARVRAGSTARIVEIAMPVETLTEAGLDPALSAPTGRHPLLEQWIADHDAPVGHLEGAVADSMGLIYTSGTTGTPKGVLRERMTPHQLLSIAGGIAGRMGLAPGGRMLVAGPMYHTSPNAVAVLALRMGTDITIMPRWDSERFLRLVHRHRIQQAKIVPTMLSRLLSLPAEVRDRYDTGSLTHLIHSAAPCPPAIKRAAIDWFGDAVIEYSGSTETGTITWISAAEWLARPGSVGRPADGSAVAILDEAGAELPAGQPGRVFVRAIRTESRPRCPSSWRPTNCRRGSASSPSFRATTPASCTSVNCAPTRSGTDQPATCASVPMTLRSAAPRALASELTVVVPNTPLRS